MDTTMETDTKVTTRKPPGRPAGYGRRGAPNKRTMAAAMVLMELQFDALAEMVGRYRDQNSSEETKDRMLLALARYQYPILKQVDVAVDQTAVEPVRFIITGA